MMAAAAELRRSFLEEVLQDGDTGQIQRGAERFALVAIAGELAAALDVVPWSPGEAAEAAAYLFKRWAADFGRKQARESLQAIRAVRAFLERYEAKFKSLKRPASKDELAEWEDHLREVEAASGGDVVSAPSSDESAREGEARSLDVAGWRGSFQGKPLFLFNTEYWRTEVFPGLEWEAATKALQAAGYLVADPGRLMKTARVPGGHTRKFYAVSGRILEAETDDDD